ncbi:MAG: PPC domain-containing DNA-binding protein [Roseiflexaceae bacterium]
MKANLLDQHGPRTYAIVFDKGDEFASILMDFAQQQKLDAASSTGIGAFSSATLGYFDRDKMDYKKIVVNEQVEVLTLAGNVAIDKAKGKPKVHAHVVVGCADGSTRGGHVLDAHVWQTLEIVLVESPQHLRHASDPETGLALLDL